MKKWVYELLRTLRGLAGFHAEYEDLLAYRDKELGRFGRWWVETHLCRCEVCRREAARIEEDLRTFKKMDHLFYADDSLNVAKGLGNLRQAIANWEARALLGDEVVEPVRTIGEGGLRQLAAEFNFYFGDRASAAFLRKVRSGKKWRRDLLIEAESVLSDFLGPRAASAVTRRVLYSQMVRDNHIQGSLAS
jgi:hypothetical protein